METALSETERMAIDLTMGEYGSESKEVYRVIEDIIRGRCRAVFTAMSALLDGETISRILAAVKCADNLSAFGGNTATDGDGAVPE